MAKSKKSKAPSQGQPSWGQGNGKKARSRRRRREAGNLDRPEPSEVRATQRPLNYGAPDPSRKPLAELPSASNTELRATMSNPSANETCKTEVIDLTGDRPRLLPRKPGFGWAHSNWRPTTGTSAGTIKTGKPDSTPVTIDKDVHRPLYSHPPCTNSGREATSPATANPTFSFGQPNQPALGFGVAAIQQKVLLHQDREANASKSAVSLGQFTKQALGFDAAAQGILGSVPDALFHVNPQTEEPTDKLGFNFGQLTDSFARPCNTSSKSQIQRIIPFGQPQRPSPGFDRIVWVRQDPETLANWTPKREKSLEGLYKEFPEKRLRSIEPDTLELVAKTIYQIASEAANEWLKTACPGTCWNDSIVNVEGLYDFNSAKLDYTILERARSVQKMKAMVTSLLENSRTMIHETINMKLLELNRLTDDSIAICQIIKDDKRRVLLQRAKEKLEWLPVGLDCKKLDIHRRARRSLVEDRAKIQKGLAQSKPSKRAELCSEAEVHVLDRALVEFQEYRLEFVIELFKTLKQLLVATA